MNSILDAALGVALVFAVFALIVSGLNEAWASVLNKRGKQLFDALNKLMGAEAHKLLTSDLLKPLTRKPITDRTSAADTKKALGAYLPSWMFAAAVLDKAHIAPAPGASLVALPAVDDLNGALGEDLAKVVRSLATSVQNDAAKLEAALATWYDGYMERVSGWYKRNARFVMFVIGLVVAIVANVDAVSVTRNVISDAPLRTALAQQATNTKTCPKGKELTCGEQDIAGLPGTQLGLFWTGTCTTTKTTGTGAAAKTVCTSNWWARHQLNTFENWVEKILGLLLGAFAISLGAPFWFDLIGRGVSLKGAGQKPAQAGADG
jgi:hypothetical protein